jgi:hypothetical protein
MAAMLLAAGLVESLRGLDAGAAELDAAELDAAELDAAELDAAELDAGELDAGRPVDTWRRNMPPITVSTITGPGG